MFRFEWTYIPRKHKGRTEIDQWQEKCNVNKMQFIDREQRGYVPI